MENCVFCKIVRGEIPSFRVWEDNEFLAILDIQPNTRGQTLVMPKEHYDSYAFEMPDDVYQRFLLAAKKIGRLLDSKLGTKRTALVIEGMGVNHAHIKLYPLHGLEKEFEPSEVQGVFFDNYPGFVTTKLGPKADFKDLEELAEKLRD